MTALAMGLDRLNQHDFGLLRDRFSEDHPDFADFFDEAAAELRKFYQLILSSKGPLANMSKKVDALWHTHVLHTPQYRAFCEQVFGFYVDHQPHSAQTPVPGEAITNFFREYEGTFGPVPSIWTEDIAASHVAAINRGELPAEMLQRRWSGWPGRI